MPPREAELLDPPSGLKITWTATLSRSANYVRQQLDLLPTTQDVPIESITLFDMDLPGARLSGPATGSPIVTPTLFLGVEDPMSSCTLTAGRARGILHVGLPIREGQHFVRSTVIGVAPEGQLRRAFLYSLERERAHPYRPFLHYTRGGALGCARAGGRQTWLSTIYRGRCLERFAVLAAKLVRKTRGAVMDSFLFAHGWAALDTVLGVHPTTLPQRFREHLTASHAQAHIGWACGSPRSAATT